jgi:hypothetical protein
MQFLSKNNPVENHNTDVVKFSDPPKLAEAPIQDPRPVAGPSADEHPADRKLREFL